MNHTSKTNKQKETKENNTPNRIKYIVFKQNFENIKKKNHLETGIQNVQRKIRQNIMRNEKKDN